MTRGAMKGQILISPAGTRWTVVKRWTRGWGGDLWYQLRSDGGRIRTMMANEFEDWKRVDS